MKKHIALLLCALLLVSVSAAFAEAAPLTLSLGDGAAIPYLDGFQSRYIADAQSIAGVTGAVDITFMQEDCGTWGSLTFEVQNITLTDDVLGVFYIQRGKKPIVYRCDARQDWNAEAYPLDVAGDFEWIDTFCEGRPIDEYTQYGMMFYTLEEPLADEAVLSFGAVWNNEKGHYEGGTRVAIDRSRLSDPTQAITPMTHIQVTFDQGEENHKNRYDFVIERVARTPFGNRLVLSFKGTSERSQYMDFRLLDENGEPLFMTSPTSYYWLDASREHPVQRRQETWFFGGDDGESVSLAPIGSAWLSHAQTGRQAVVPLSALPTDITLENGTVMHIESCDIMRGGLEVLYSLKGEDSFTCFDLAGADGRSLGLGLRMAWGQWSNADRVRRLYSYFDSWAGVADGKVVYRVSEEELSQAENLIVDYTVGDQWLLRDDAVTIPLDFE